METKFIEGTNKQYSIREDGIVIRHWHYYHNRFKNERFISYKDKIRNPIGRFNIFIINGTTYSQRFLLAEYFSELTCQKCKNTYKTNIVTKYCKTCLGKNKQEYNTKWSINNPNKRRYHIKKSKLKVINDLPRSLISQNLRIPVNLLSNELYYYTKQRILLKRYKKEFNNNINELIKNKQKLCQIN